MGFDSFMLVFPNAEQNEKDIAIYVEGGFEISAKGNSEKVPTKKDPEVPIDSTELPIEQ